MKHIPITDYKENLCQNLIEVCWEKYHCWNQKDEPCMFFYEIVLSLEPFTNTLMPLWMTLCFYRHSIQKDFRTICIIKSQNNCILFWIFIFLVCIPGYERSRELVWPYSECVKCGIGYFKEDVRNDIGEDYRCHKCGNYSITLHTGSTNRDQCSKHILYHYFVLE